MPQRIQTGQEKLITIGHWGQIIIISYALGVLRCRRAQAHRRVGLAHFHQPVVGESLTAPA